MSNQRRRAGGPPTLEEVAARAGVGRGTVSRVVNGSPQVSPKAREAVTAAIEELGYVPNRAARTLVTQRTDSVALVVSESEDRLFGEPFFASIIRGVSAVLAEESLQLWLALASSPGDRRRVERHLTSQYIDGVLLLSLHDEDPLPALLRDRGVPTVLGGRPARMLAAGASSDDGPDCYVDVDNAGGARLAVTHLIRSGRRRIAAVAGPQDMGVGLTRLTGYRDALADAGMPVDESLIGYGDFSEASGAAAMRGLLDHRADLDGVFVASDLMAAGALRALREGGRAVPADVAVVGFEDSAIASQTDPPLTTVHQPVERMGREMARLLVNQIRGTGGARAVLLDTHLVGRASA